MLSVVTETPKASDKRSRRATPKTSDMNDAANNYYVNMLEIQKRLAQKQLEVLEIRVSLLRSKEENEKLKNMLLKKQLGEVDKNEGSDDSDEESDDDMRTLNQAEFML